MKQLKLNQAGDTLVEVVLAIAILGTVIATSFSVANYSYRIGVQAREHTQAAHILQDQAERFRRYRDQLIQPTPDAPVLDPSINMLVGTPFAAAAMAQTAPTADPIPAGYIMTTQTVSGVDKIVPVSAVATEASAPPQNLCFGLPDCQLTSYVRTTSSPANALLTKMDILIYITWTSAIGSDKNSLQINYALTDTRAIQQGSCDNGLAGDCP